MAAEGETAYMHAIHASVVRYSTTTQELNECQSSLRRTKEELQKAKRDLLTVKQQAHQQKQANERQLERLRSRFSDESIKSLRAKVPEIYFANAKKSAQSFSSAAPSGLERKQVEELEGKRRNLLESNAALKRMTTESLNLAREAARYLERIEVAGNEKACAALGSSSSSSSSSGGGNTASCPLFYQRDLFPSQSPLISDYASHSTAGPGKKHHPAVEALHQMSELIHTRGSRLIQSLSAARAGGPTLVGPEEDLGIQKARREDAVRERQLIKALQRVQELEAEQSMAAAIHNQKKDGEDRIKQMAEVEKQRQRYIALCRELQTQEELLRREREALERDKEEVLKMEMSMSVQEDSHLSLDHPIKRSREEEKENEAVPKRNRVEQPSPREDTMRFVTVRKQRRVP